MIIENIQAYYVSRSGHDVRAVDDVSLSINDGEVFGIVGESGCGKSTLASVMSLTAARSLKVKQGNMILDGETISLTDLQKVPKDWYGERVALLPQRAMNSLNPTARVRDIIVGVVRSHDPDKRPQEAVIQARERLQQLGLPVRVLELYPHQLSGGMRQRVVAVISTLLNPNVLIADEPTSALDVSSQVQLLDLLRQLLELNFIRRCVLITHDLPMLSNIADRIAVMYAGKIAEIGSTGQIINNPQHPYTKALIGSTLDLDPALRNRQLKGIPGSPPDLRTPPSGCRFHPRCPHVMDVCSQDIPPHVGDEQRFAACWWVQENSKQSNLEETAQ
jgi:peptide/nickel transport system ATP-binding protein